MGHHSVYFKGEFLKIPFSGPENRHQAAALVAQAQKMLPGTWGKNEFSESELVALRRSSNNLNELSKSLQKSALERLADAGVDDGEKLWDYYSPLYRYLTKATEAEALKLALTIMRDYVSDDAFTNTAEMLAGETSAGAWGKTQRSAPISVCSWCEGRANIRLKGKPDVECKLCKGEGFVYEEEASGESWLSEEGCYALSSDEPWTIEDEAKVQGYDSLAQAKDHHDWWPPKELE